MEQRPVSQSVRPSVRYGDATDCVTGANETDSDADFQTWEGTLVRALGKQEATQWSLIRASLYFACTKNKTIMKRITITITSQLSSSSHLAWRQSRLRCSAAWAAIFVVIKCVHNIHITKELSHFIVLSAPPGYFLMSRTKSGCNCIVKQAGSVAGFIIQYHCQQVQVSHVMRNCP